MLIYVKAYKFRIKEKLLSLGTNFMVWLVSLFNPSVPEVDYR